MELEAAGRGTSDLSPAEACHDRDAVPRLTRPMSAGGVVLR